MATTLADTGISKAYSDELFIHRASGGDAASRIYHKYRPLIIFLVLVALGIAFHFWPEEWWLYSTAHSLSDALIVAGLLGVTVDRFLKHDLIRDVGAIFIGWALPDEIRNNIREVSNTSLVRRNYRAEFVFAANGDDVVIDATEEWEVFNYSSGTRPYQSHMAISLMDGPERDRIGCELTTQDRVSIFTAEQLNSENRLEEKETRLIYRLPTTKLRSQDIEDRRTAAACRVKWHYRMTKKQHDGIVQWSTLPTITLNIRIRCGCGLRFEFDPDEVEHAEGSTEWRYPGLFMPLQAFSIRWHPVKPA